MEIKYYIGMKEVSMAAFEKAEKEAMADGRMIKSTATVDGYPTYTMENGTVVRGDKKGGFNVMLDGKVGPSINLATMNEWVQDEPTDVGKGMFFVQE